MNTKPHSNYTRRDAVRHIALGGLALSVAPSVLSQAQSNGQRKLGVALVGLGNYSNAMLGPALLETERCELRGIVTGTPDKAKAWSKKYGIPKSCIYDYTTFDQIADNPEIDIVYVVLPNFLHAEYTIRAAQAGKHVICEKPMALNPVECEQMIEACRKAERKLSIGYRLRFDPFHRQAIRIAQNQDFGAVKMIEASLAFNYPNPSSWRFKIKEGGGGAIMDLGVYCIQAARYISGEEPISVTAQSFNNEKDRFVEIPEGYTFQLKFPGGAVSNHFVAYSSYVDRLYANGSKNHNWLELNPSFQGSSNAPQGRSSSGPMEFKRVNQAAAQMDDFARCINANDTSIVAGEEGLADMKIVSAIKQAASEGRSVNL